MNTPLPRNVQSLAGIERGSTVIASFVGSTGYPNRHVFADSGRRYDWRFAKDVHLAIAVKPGVDAGHALAEIVKHSDLVRGFPTLIDLEREECACVMPPLYGGAPVRLWWARRGTELWRQHFE